jgi:hypothetical protein
VSAAHGNGARYDIHVHRPRRRAWSRVAFRVACLVAFLLAFLVCQLPRSARADTGSPPLAPRLAPHGPLERLAAGVALFALSGVTAVAGLSRRPPVSLVAVAWPWAARPDDATERRHPPTWTVPAGGRKPMFFASLVDVRF